MDQSIRRMSEQEAAAYRAQYRKSTQKAGQGRFQHFADDAAKQQHMEAVKRDQDSGTTPF